jgi:hypothetical protein
MNHLTLTSEQAAKYSEASNMVDWNYEYASVERLRICYAALCQRYNEARLMVEEGAVSITVTTLTKSMTFHSQEINAVFCELAEGIAKQVDEVKNEILAAILENATEAELTSDEDESGAIRRELHALCMPTTNSVTPAPTSVSRRLPLVTPTMEPAAA